jgi:hypothetical protein
MTTDEILSFRRAVPFRPFELRLKDGRRFVVKDFSNIGRGAGDAVIVAAGDESFEKFEPGDVVAIKPLTVRRGRGKSR